MASINTHIQILTPVIFFTFIFCINQVFSADPQENSPSPSPHPPADALSPPPVLSPATPSQSPSPAPSPSLSSPTAPPPLDLSPAPSPTLTNASAPRKSPTLAPAVAGDAEVNASNVESKLDSSSGGMNGGKKAGVVVAVVASACIVGVGALIYKKRQQNVRRSQYRYAARREILGVLFQKGKGEAVATYCHPFASSPIENYRETRYFSTLKS